MKEKLTQLLQEGQEKIRAARSEGELQEVKGLLLGKQGALTGLLKELPRLDVSLRPEMGKAVNQAKAQLTELLESKREQFDPRVFLTPIMETVMTGAIPDEDTAAITDCIERGVKEVVGTLIVQFGSYGKAPLVEQVSLEEMADRYRKMQVL